MVHFLKNFGDKDNFNLGMAVTLSTHATQKEDYLFNLLVLVMV